MSDALQDWIQREAIPCALEASATFDAAVDRVVAALDDARACQSVQLLGFGEALHGGEDILLLRNRLFQRLTTAHGYSAIVFESSFPAGRLMNDYVAGAGPDAYDEVRDVGISHGFGRLEVNRELLEWMRHVNADPSRSVKLRFYGCDIPTGATGYAGPRQVLPFAVNYLAARDEASGAEHRRRIDLLLGQDADWENPAAYTDPTKGMGGSASAAALRIATEDLLTELRIRRPEFVAQSGRDQYLEAMQHAVTARELLNSYAALAAKAGNGVLLGIRDALMADNLAYIVDRERDRGKVLAFAHNSHLQRGKVVQPWAQWWPAGSHMHDRLGPRYAVIGTAVGVSEQNGIGPAEAGCLEARLTAAPGPLRFIPTHGGEGLPAAEIAALPTRSFSRKNPSYIPLVPQSFTDFDWLAVVDSTTYHRGGTPLPDPAQSSGE